MNLFHNKHVYLSTTYIVLSLTITSFSTSVSFLSCWGCILMDYSNREDGAVVLASKVS